MSPCETLFSLVRYGILSFDISTVVILIFLCGWNTLVFNCMFSSVCYLWLSFANYPHVVFPVSSHDQPNSRQGVT